MAVTGDWVTPRLYGQPWFEKPILYYWAAAIGFQLHLPTEWALRLPSSFAALGAAVVVGWLSSKHYARAARSMNTLAAPTLLAPLLFSTTVAAIGFARAATPDMLFSAFIALAMACAADIFRRRGLLRSAVPVAGARQKFDAPALLLFGAFLGMAVLAKGPAAVLLAAGAIVLWALATGRWSAAFGLAHPYALASFCVVTLPWYLLCARRNPDFLRVFIFQHNFERYLTPVFQHRQPFWFFAPITFLALLPWTALLWPAVQEGLRLWREKSWHDSPGLFFACWAVFPVLFFSLSQSKLPSYILPAIPALALLSAASLCRMAWSSSGKTRVASPIGFAIAGTWSVLGVAAIILAHRLPAAQREAAGNSILLAACVAFAGALAVGFLAFRGQKVLVTLSVLLATAVVTIANTGILPKLDPFLSARWHVQLLRNDRHPDRIFAYRLPRSWTYGFAFYLGRELPEWSASDPNPALVLTTPAGLREIRQVHRFYGELDETAQGILYVPIGPAPR